MVIKQVLNRFYVQDMDQAIKFYEKILNEKCRSRIQYAEAHLELAWIGNLLILSGSEGALKPFRTTQATFAV